VLAYIKEKQKENQSTRFVTIWMVMFLLLNSL